MATRSESSQNSQYDFSPSDERPVFFTDAAVAAAKNAIESEGRPGDGLRISIVGGGCAGYQYNLDFEQEERIGDVIMDFNGLKFFIDSVSTGYLWGTVIDYITGLQGSGFKFINPNARRTCGCGSSFS